MVQEICGHGSSGVCMDVCVCVCVCVGYTGSNCWSSVSERAWRTVPSNPRYIHTHSHTHTHTHKLARAAAWHPNSHLSSRRSFVTQATGFITEVCVYACVCVCVCAQINTVSQRRAASAGRAPLHMRVQEVLRNKNETLSNARIRKVRHTHTRTHTTQPPPGADAQKLFLSQPWFLGLSWHTRLDIVCVCMCVCVCVGDGRPGHHVPALSQP